MSGVRYIAIHLPQFHPIPENDAWWGKGFTEWTNVTRARPRFRGHYQPHLPADLGFYDLRLPEARAAQAELAAAHGIDAFCYYHYWFHGRRLLSRPVDEILQSGQPDFPFCLCWANEGWSRRWDGSNESVLIAQRYSKEDDEAHIRHLLPAFHDPRYLRVGGRPLFLIYRAQDIPHLPRLVARFQERARASGLPGLFLVSVRNGWNRDLDPRTLGLDASLKFQPFFPIADRLLAAQTPRPDLLVKGLEAAQIAARKLGLRDEAQRAVYHALDLARQASAARDRVLPYTDFVTEAMREAPAPFPEFPAVCPGWDNSPRRPGGALVLSDGSPRAFGSWLRHETEQIVQRAPPEERLVFLNAWNEWAEGNHLEPDQRFGRAFLEEVRACKVFAAQPPAPVRLPRPIPSAQRPLRVVALMARYGDEKYPGALEDLLAFYERTLDRGDAVEVLVVDNRLPPSAAQAQQAPAPPSPVRAVHLAGGDNSAWEWSAWERGRALFADQIAGADLVHLVTDAFRNPPTQYLEDIDRTQLMECVERQFCLGSLDMYLTPHTAFEHSIQTWIRTCFFFLPPGALLRLGSLLSVTEPGPLFSGSPEAPFAQDAPMDPGLQQIFLDWLTGPGQFGVQWHSRFALSAQTLPLFQAKTVSLLNELLLSARLRAAGVTLVDASYLRLQRAIGRTLASKAPADLSISPVDQVRLREDLRSGNRAFSDGLLWAEALVRGLTAAPVMR
jgi:hypothetical protein